MQRIRRGKYFSPCKLGETPNTQALRSAFGQVEPMQRCGISVPKAQKLCAQQGANPFKREPSVAVSESQNLRFCYSNLYSVVAFESLSKILFDKLKRRHRVTDVGAGRRDYSGLSTGSAFVSLSFSFGRIRLRTMASSVAMTTGDLPKMTVTASGNWLSAVEA